MKEIRIRIYSDRVVRTADEHGVRLGLVDYEIPKIIAALRSQLELIKQKRGSLK
ncbi:hypothetical protein LCGC14_2998810 [marine sediment metagenome]|uniref:Uncharacterized protein n=1 Tax=marine sediment metagenome TaxID=412755 RepID=A0A0F8Z989_9ZZZZ